MIRAPGLDAHDDNRQLEVLWEDGERKFCKIWRDDADGTQRLRIAVLPSTEHPRPATLGRLVHEHALKEQIDGAWGLRPLELVRSHGRTMLLFDYVDCRPFEHLLDAPMEIGRYLRLAIVLARSLAGLHGRGLVHKDIKPANILVDQATDRIWLTGFGIATRLPREHQALEAPELIVGTLSHMAPEQTGIMNRSIDSRSDLYSLGVTLYQALTGVLPFTATDPMEWVHCHIARRPLPPVARVVSIPTQVSAIIMRLLAKTPEERYQTATGVEHDLKRCLSDWESRRVIDEVSLGARDTPERLLMSERLYGREGEVQALLAAFDEVALDGTRKLVLIRGNPGIGKSSVVAELHRVLVPPRGLFAFGKFDQLKRDIPYAPLVQALQSLFRRLLGKPEAELSKWRDDLRAALNPNAGLVAALIPELRFIIGEQHPGPDSPSPSKARLQLAFRALIGVFARPEHPLALFFDDLQWLDTETLDLLEDLLVQSDLRCLLLLGACRDTEVNAAHPLSRKLSAIREAGAKVQEIELGPLQVDDLVCLIADALHCGSQRAMPLARLVHEKTAGNPYFVNQFIRALADEELVKFEIVDAIWVWDLGAIQAKVYTENVAHLMVEKLRRLPVATQKVLSDLACLGGSAPASRLALVSDATDEAVYNHLWEALRVELVARSGDSYRFTHDRVQEAAYSLVPEEGRAQAHLRVGRLLAAQFHEDSRGDAVFEVVGQLNRGSALIGSSEDRVQLAELNLAAGKRAKAAAAFPAALTYLTAGAALAADDWGRHHGLCFELEFDRAECEFLIGLMPTAEARLSALKTRASSPVERAAVACLLADVYIALRRLDRSVVVCLEYVRHVGVDIPLQPTDAQARAAYDRVWSQLGSRSIEQVAELPVLNDVAARATVDVLAKIARAALTEIDMNLLCVILCAAVERSLALGNCDSSCYAYEYFGVMAGWRFGDFDAGARFGRLGLELVEHKELRQFEALVCLTLAIRIVPWADHVRKGRPLLRRAFDLSKATGDRVSAVSSCCALISNLLMAGEPLAEVEKESEMGQAFCHRAAFRDFIDAAATQAAFIRNLRGRTRRVGSFDDERFDELRMQAHFESEPHARVFECWYWIRKLQARFFAGDYAAALDAAGRARALLSSSPALVEAAEYELYSALAHAAICDTVASSERPRYLETVSGHLRQLDLWARHCPENFHSRAALVAAEVARIEGRETDAMRSYEQAVQSAQSNGFIHNEALATELAAYFYEARGFHKIANAYLRDACHCYLQWGADGKARQLEGRYPHLRTHDASAALSRTMETPVEHLDLATVLKVLQTVSGETDLQRLIAMVMRLAIEHAGAERGLLILPRGEAYRIEAEAEVSSDGVNVVQRQSLVTSTDLPEAVFNYVLRTRETVLVNDASSANEFANQERDRWQRVRSALCMPLLKQGRLIAVLYLENNLTSGAFTSARMATLKLLASEAAISLENAELYRALREREARVRRLVDSNIIGIIIWRADGRVLDTNDAFLRLVGYERDDLLSGRVLWTDLIPSESRERAVRTLELMQEFGAIQAREREYVRKDGTRVQVLMAGATFEQEPYEGVAFILDLSDRKRAEEAQRASERNLQLTLDTMPALAWTARPDGPAESFNEHYLDYVGMSAEQAMGWGWAAAVHPDDLGSLVAVWQRIVASEAPGEAEARLRRHDGEYRWFLFRTNPLRDEGGSIVKWYGVNTDIEDRKRAEDELRRAYNSFAEAQKLSRTGSFIADLVADDYNWSEETFRIFEFEPSTKVSLKRMRDVIHPNDWPSFDAAIARGMTGVNVELAFRILTERGALKHVRGVAQVVEQVAGRPLFVGALQDVTESKVAEEAADRARSELAHVARVASLSTLTASIAHEVNQPLSGIITNAGTCLRMLDGDRPNIEGARETARRTIRDGQRAADVVTRLRALYSKRPFTLDSLDLNDATRDVVGLSTSELHRNGVSVQLELAEDLPPVIGDRVQLQQVVLNLLRNASDAMLGVHERPRRLLIRTEADGADRVRVTVRDAGIGLDLQRMDRLFEAFYTTKRDGMGMGLSVSRSIIESHHGRLWAEPNDGPGATFAFSIPRVPAD